MNIALEGQVFSSKDIAKAMAYGENNSPEQVVSDLKGGYNDVAVTYLMTRCEPLLRRIFWKKVNDKSLDGWMDYCSKVFEMLLSTEERTFQDDGHIVSNPLNSFNLSKVNNDPIKALIGWCSKSFVNQASQDKIHDYDDGTGAGYKSNKGNISLNSLESGNKEVSNSQYDRRRNEFENDEGLATDGNFIDNIIAKDEYNSFSKRWSAFINDKSLNEPYKGVSLKDVLKTCARYQSLGDALKVLGMSKNTFYSRQRELADILEDYEITSADLQRAVKEGLLEQRKRHFENLHLAEQRRRRIKEEDEEFEDWDSEGYDDPIEITPEYIDGMHYDDQDETDYMTNYYGVLKGYTTDVMHPGDKGDGAYYDDTPMDDDYGDYNPEYTFQLLDDQGCVLADQDDYEHAVTNGNADYKRSKAKRDKLVRHARYDCDDDWGAAYDCFTPEGRYTRTVQQGRTDKNDKMIPSYEGDRDFSKEGINENHTSYYLWADDENDKKFYWTGTKWDDDEKHVKLMTKEDADKEARFDGEAYSTTLNNGEDWVNLGISSADVRMND